MMGENKARILLVLCLILLCFALGWLTVTQKTQPLELQIEELEKEIIDRQTLLNINLLLMEEIQQLREENENLQRRMEEWLDEWGVEEVEITAYAPLDPRAVEGMCYSGNPNITTSGAKVVPGETLAAGPDVEFGTRVWVNGSMWVVQDRGGMVNRNDEGLRQLDLAVWTREEAFRIGRQRTVAVFEK